MPEKRETLLTVDFSYQVYRATCANPGLTSGDTFTGGLYGFFMWLGKAVRETRATRLAICLDTKPYRRSVTYPQYKLLRNAHEDPETKKRYEVSKRLVLEVLFEVGAPIYALQGFEYDDIAAAISLRYRHRMDRIYAGTNDSDMYQLLWMDNFAIFRNDMDNLVTSHTLMRDLGVTPHQYMVASALQGTHNGVEGIPNVGPVRALRTVRDASLMRLMRSKWAELIDRNLGLIHLPHEELPSVASLLDAPTRGFNPRTLYRALAVYDVDTTEWMVKAFEQTSV